MHINLGIEPRHVLVIPSEDIFILSYPLVCFEIMGMHVPNRVLHQFGLTQSIRVVDQLAQIDRVSMCQCDWRQESVLILVDAMIESISFRAKDIAPHYPQAT